MRPDRRAKANASASISKQLQASLSISTEPQEPLIDSSVNQNAPEDDDDDDEEMNLPLRPSLGGITSPKKRPRVKRDFDESEIFGEFDGKDGDSSSASLYTRLRTPKANVKHLVARWVDKYNQNKDAACWDLHNLIAEASGCPHPLPTHVWRKDLSDVLVVMTQDFTESSTGSAYPMAMPGPQLKKFRATMTDFIKALIEACQYSIIYDGVMLERFTSFLGAMADSQVRAFRHTGTFVVLRVMTALVTAMLKVEGLLDGAQRLLDAERAKSRERASKERLATLQKNLNTLEDHLEELKRVIVSSFKVVYIHRYRDVFAEIRILCMEEAGQWMLQHPAFFLDDSYLKYIGWTLSDKVGDVRLACLKALEPLYSHDELKHKLELFTGRFKRRFVEMTFDKELEVAVKAAKLLTTIDQLYPDILEPRECESIYELVFSRHGDVAHAAGSFVHGRLFTEAVEPNPDDASLILALDESTASTAAPETNTSSQSQEAAPPVEPATNGPRRSARSRAKQAAVAAAAAASAPPPPKKQLGSPNAKCLRTLALFIVQSSLHQHAAYVVDSLWAVSPMLRDWSAMVQILMNDSDEINQDESQASSSLSPCTAMVDILVSAAHQAATNEPPPGREQHHHGKPSREAQKSLQADRRRLSECLIPAFPLLLSRFVADSEKVALLLELPAYFDLEVYTKNRLERSMDQTLRCLTDIVQRHTNPDILKAVASTFETFCDDKFNISTRCLIARNNLLDSTTGTFQNAYQELSQRDWASDHGRKLVYSTFFACLRKLAAFFQHHDLTKWQIVEPCLAILRQASERKIPNTESESVEAAAKCVYLSLAWLTHHLSSNPDDVNTQQSVLRLQTSFIDYLIAILEVESLKRTFDTIFACLCDTLLMFPQQIAEEKATMAPLIYKPTARVQDTIIKFISDQMLQCAASGASANDTESQSSLHTAAAEDTNDVGALERLTTRRNNIAALARLIMCGQLEPSAIVPLIRYYAKNNTDYNDLIKVTLGKCREISQEETGKAMHSGLVSVYLSCMRTRKEPYSRSAPELLPARELARKLVMSFGVDSTRARLGVMALHNAGIKFAFKQTAPGTVPPDLPYLDLLNEFVPKLLRQDRVIIKQALDAAIASMGTAQPSGDTLEALNNYKKNVSADDTLLTAPLAPPSTVGSRMTAATGGSDTVVAGRGRGKRKMSNISVGSGWATPALTSTVLRPTMPPKPGNNGIELDHEDGDDDDEDEDITLSLLTGHGQDSPIKRPKPEPIGISSILEPEPPELGAAAAAAKSDSDSSSSSEESEEEEQQQGSSSNEDEDNNDDGDDDE